MGLFKQIKDSKTFIAAAPGLIDQANQMGAAAQASQAAQQADLASMQADLAQQQAAMSLAGPALSDGQSAPIAGVDLDTYAWVVKQIAPLGYDQSLLPGIAAQRGISASDWQTAMDGWALRIEDPAVATAFRRRYDAS